MATTEMTIQELAQTASAVCEKFAGAGSAVSQPSRLARVRGGAESVARVIGRPAEEVAAVCAAITSALETGAPDEWGEKGSPFRTALVAELRKVAEVTTPPAAPVTTTATAPQPPRPETAVNPKVLIRVSAIMRDLKYGLSSGEPLADLRLDDESVGRVAEAAAKKGGDFSVAVREVCEDLADRAELKTALFHEAKARGYRVVKGEAPVKGAIHTPLFSAILGTAGYAVRALEMPPEVAVKAAFDELGLVPIVAPIAAPNGDEEREIDLDNEANDDIVV